jgi:hypothetical protein
MVEIKMLNSRSNINGIAKSIWLRTSGGVRRADKIKLNT